MTGNAYFYYSQIFSNYDYVTTTAPGGLVVERSPSVREVVGSIPGRVIPKTLKMVLDASLLSARHLKDRSRTYGSPVVDCKM